MATFLTPPLAYGQSQPLVEVMPMVQEFPGVPTAQTRGVLGQLLINSLAPGNVYMLTGIIGGNAQWSLVVGGAGNFNSLTVTTTITAGGNITSGANIGATVDMAAGRDITAGRDVISTEEVIVGTNVLAAGFIQATGNILSDTGNVGATAGAVLAFTDVTAGRSVIALGDVGDGEAGGLTITNALNDTQGVGEMTILSTNGNAGENAGFLKMYIGVGQTVWVPYFDDIAP